MEVAPVGLVSESGEFVRPGRGCKLYHQCRAVQKEQATGRKLNRSRARGAERKTGDIPHLRHPNHSRAEECISGNVQGEDRSGGVCEAERKRMSGCFRL